MSARRRWDTRVIVDVATSWGLAAVLPGAVLLGGWWASR